MNVGKGYIGKTGYWKLWRGLSEREIWTLLFLPLNLSKICNGNYGKKIDLAYIAHYWIRIYWNKVSKVSEGNFLKTLCYNVKSFWTNNSQLTLNKPTVIIQCDSAFLFKKWRDESQYLKEKEKYNKQNIHRKSMFHSVLKL